MKQSWVIRFVLLVLSSTICGTTFAQEEIVQVNSNSTSVHISWPVPVTEIWGTGDIIGTANATDMLYFYLEYKPLNDDMAEPENAPWIPLTPAMSNPVIDDVLATIDTTDVPDGLYTLRLTVNTSDNQGVHYEVAPLRISNERFTRIEDAIRDDERQKAGLELEPVPPIVTPNVPDDNLPRVTPEHFAVNVRRCTLVDNDRCPAIASLEPELYADVLGTSPDLGWSQIQTQSGTIGWVKRTVVIETGDFKDVPIVTPPAPLPAPPVIQQLPVLLGNVIPTGMAIEGGNATCGVTYNVQINVNNTGSTQSATGSVLVQDVNVRTGEITATGSGAFPVIEPGQDWVVVIPMRTSVYFNEEHELRAYVNGRQFTIRYNLQPGGCTVATHLSETPLTGSRNFNERECSLVLNLATNAWDKPNQNVVSSLDSATYTANKLRTEAGVRWYRITDRNLWLPSNVISGYIGNCNP